MLLLGGSAVINAITGMNIYAAAFLIPIGIIMYTAIGGLKVCDTANIMHKCCGRSSACLPHVNVHTHAHVDISRHLRLSSIAFSYLTGNVHVQLRPHSVHLRRALHLCVRPLSILMLTSLSCFAWWPFLCFPA